MSRQTPQIRVDEKILGGGSLLESVSVAGLCGLEWQTTGQIFIQVV